MGRVIAGALAAVLVLSFIIPADAQTSDFELLGSRTYIDSAGNFHIVGEVKNTTNRTWRFIEVTVPLIDENDLVIAAPTRPLFVEYLRPEESGVFHILLEETEAEFDAAVGYAVHLNYVTAPTIPEGLLDVRLLNATFIPGGGYRISGEVANLGSMTATLVQVSAALYDINNRLIDTTVGFSDDIPPGETAPFSLVSGVLNAGDAEHISLNVQSQEYIMIPEFPIPALGLIAGLAATILLARRYHRQG